MNVAVSFPMSMNPRLLTRDVTTIRLAGPLKKSGDDASAHPGDENFDRNQASAQIGDLAEAVRKFFADKLHCRPPGLETNSEADGSITIKADNPEVGVGLKVIVSLLKAQAPETVSAPESAAPPGGFGFGPQLPPPAPAPPPQPPAAPPAPTPQPAGGFGYGPVI